MTRNRHPGGNPKYGMASGAHSSKCETCSGTKKSGDSENCSPAQMYQPDVSPSGLSRKPFRGAQPLPDVARDANLQHLVATEILGMETLADRQLWIHTICTHRYPPAVGPDVCLLISTGPGNSSTLARWPCWPIGSASHTPGPVQRLRRCNEIT